MTQTTFKDCEIPVKTICEFVHHSRWFLSGKEQLVNFCAMKQNFTRFLIKQIAELRSRCYSSHLFIRITRFHLSEPLLYTTKWVTGRKLMCSMWRKTRLVKSLLLLTHRFFMLSIHRIYPRITGYVFACGNWSAHRASLPAGRLYR